MSGGHEAEGPQAKDFSPSNGESFGVGRSSYLISQHRMHPMPYWQNDTELFALARRELFPAVVGDVMDKLGLLHQFLPPRIQPLRDDMVVIGRAMPVLEADIDTGSESATNQPFGLMF